MEKSIKRITFFTLGMLTAALILTGCSGSSGTPINTVTETVTEEPAYVPTAEDDYLSRLATAGNSIADSTSDSDLIDLGYQNCELLDDGYTVTEIVEYMTTSGKFSTNEEYSFIGAIIGASVFALCPEYEGQVNDFLN
jgi:hypothetical protein